MQIEIFSDVVCPWCYIGKRRLEEALTTFEHADDVTVTFRSFQLDPSAPAKATVPTTQLLSEKYGMTVAQAEASNRRLTELAATVGLEYHLDKTLSVNTFTIHRLLHFAAAQGRQHELKEAVMHAYFTDGADLSDSGVLIGLTESVGLDPVAAREVLDSEYYTDAVEADIALARGFGATGVPFFVFDRKYAVSGAQETAVFAQVLDQAWSEAHR